MWHPAEFVLPECEKAGSTETNKNRNIDNTINILMLLPLGSGIKYSGIIAQKAVAPPLARMNKQEKIGCTE